MDGAWQIALVMVTFECLCSGQIMKLDRRSKSYVTGSSVCIAGAICVCVAFAPNAGEQARVASIGLGIALIVVGTLITYPKLWGG